MKLRLAVLAFFVYFAVVVVLGLTGFLSDGPAHREADCLGPPSQTC